MTGFRRFLITDFEGRRGPFPHGSRRSLPPVGAFLFETEGPFLDAVEHRATLERGLGRPAQSAAVSAFGSSRSMSFWKTASKAGS